MGTAVSSTTRGCFLVLNEDYSTRGYFIFSGSYENKYIYIPSYNRFLYFVGNANYNRIEVFDGGSISTGSGEITDRTSLGYITLPTISGRSFVAQQVFVSADYSRIFIPYSNYSNLIWLVYDLDDLLHTDGNGNLDPIFTEIQRSDTLVSPSEGISIKGISISRGSERIVMANTSTSDVIVWNNSIDKNNVIMVKYKNMWFQRLKYGQLTAGQPDVKDGKTFIGWMGYPEIGTNNNI